MYSLLVWKERTEIISIRFQRIKTRVVRMVWIVARRKSVQETGALSVRQDAQTK